MPEPRDLSAIVAKLERNLRRLQLALHYANVGVWEWHIPTGEVTWSPEMERIHGVAEGGFSEATLEDYQSYVVPEDRQQVAEAVRAAIAEMQDFRLQYRILRSDNQVRWVDATGKVVTDDVTQAASLIGTCRDITDEKRLQAALEHERKQLRHIFEQAPAAISITQGADHLVTFMNLQARRLVGDRPVIGRRVREAFPELEGQGYFELLDQVFRTGAPFVGERMHARWDKHGTGEVVDGFFNIVYQPLRDEEGTVWGIMSHSIEVFEPIGR